jgi:hypothetical protein
VSPCSLVPLKVLSLVAFLVEDACVGVFMISYLLLAGFYAKFLSSLPSFAFPSRIAIAIGLCFYTFCGKG